MPANYVRATTYFDPTILNIAKKQAIDKNVSFYEYLNQKLREVILNTKPLPVISSRKLTYEELFGPPLGGKLKKQNLTRADYYS